jgi:hypothetical protein
MRSGYERENVDDEDGIFRFEGEDEEEQVWTQGNRKYSVTCANNAEPRVVQEGT